MRNIAATHVHEAVATPVLRRLPRIVLQRRTSTKSSQLPGRIMNRFETDLGTFRQAAL
jgi:hypothetical protein